MLREKLSKVNFIYKIIILSLFIYFFSWFIVYKFGINDLAVQSEDVLPAMILPVTIIKEGAMYVDNYYNFLIDKYPNSDRNSTIKTPPHYLKITYNHYVSTFPVITPILSTPVYFFPLIMGMPITWENLTIISRISSALIVAISGGVFYLLLRDCFLLSEKKSKLLAITYLFGTINFSLISQSLWQHNSTELFVILGLYFLLLPKKINYYKNIFLSGVFLGLAVTSRPMAVLILIILVSFIIKEQYRNKIVLVKSLLIYILGVMPALIFMLLYNQVYFGNFFNSGYASQLNNSWWSVNFIEGFIGIWLSPSKGILIYTPVFIFAFFYLFDKHLLSKIKDHFSYIIFTIIVLTYTLIIGMWKQWWGGYAFGYRLAADIIPFLVILLIPYLKSTVYEKTKKYFHLLLSLSILIQIYGITFFDSTWHSAYDRGHKDTSWLWSVKNSEFVFDARRVLVKLDVLEKACDVCEPK